jgi:predicted nucleic acid-binding protein
VIDKSVVVDASVWVSAFMPLDVNHPASRLWLEHYISEGGLIVAPTFLMIEVAAAVSRQARQPAAGRGAVKGLYYVPAMRWRSPDRALFWAEVEVAADLQLRAGDASYVTLARQLNIPLVSWDREQLQKAGNLVATYTPSNYPFQDVPLPSLDNPPL